jgi:hypothetical protein
MPEHSCKKNQVACLPKIIPTTLFQNNVNIPYSITLIQFFSLVQERNCFTTSVFCVLQKRHNFCICILAFGNHYPQLKSIQLIFTLQWNQHNIIFMYFYIMPPFKILILSKCLKIKAESFRIFVFKRIISTLK